MTWTKLLMTIQDLKTTIRLLHFYVQEAIWESCSIPTEGITCNANLSHDQGENNGEKRVFRREKLSGREQWVGRPSHAAKWGPILLSRVSESLRISDGCAFFCLSHFWIGILIKSFLFFQINHCLLYLGRGKDNVFFIIFISELGGVTFITDIETRTCHPLT